MNTRRPLSFQPEPLDYELTPEERSQLVGFAIGRALTWAIGAGAIWFSLRGFMSSAEPTSSGIAFVTLVFVVVFFWKRRTYRRQMEELLKNTQRNLSNN